MVVIRLARAGAKKKPYYNVVVADRRMPRDGRFIEHIGHYRPQAAEHAFDIKLDRVDHWVKLGAQPSLTVATLIAKKRAAQPSEL